MERTPSKSSAKVQKPFEILAVLTPINLIITFVLIKQKLVIIIKLIKK